MRRGAGACLAALALGAGLNGCNAEADGEPQAAPSTASAPTPSPTQDEQALLLDQYRKFWTLLTPVSRMPAGERQAQLLQVATDPALKSLLDGMRKADAKRQVFYGAGVPRPTARISPDGGTALVDDCQDGSKAGIADRDSGKRLTVGVARNHVMVTMKRQQGAIWKVAFIAYTKTPC
jgi:hypothetical protein